MRYTVEQIREIHDLPLTTLIFKAQEIHHRFQDPAGVQLSALKSIKTGGCSEDCKYCPQSAHNDAGVQRESLLDTETVLKDAIAAKESGATRFCMGAAWRRVPRGPQFESLLETVSAVSGLDLEVCLTLGSIEEDQVLALREAGCDIYNHNIDTSREFYDKIITTRSFDERLDTIRKVREVGMDVCSGGIIGMGESIEDRIKMIHELANMNPYPDSVPVNALIPCAGTPLEDRPFVDGIEFVRVIATARITMPKAMVRLSAGRSAMSDELQAMCFLAGANSLFLGDKLLTADNPSQGDDQALLAKLGLKSIDPEASKRIHAAAEREHGDCRVESEGLVSVS